MLCQHLPVRFIKSYFNPNLILFRIHRLLNPCKNPLDKSLSYGFCIILYLSSFSNVEIASSFYDNPLLEFAAFLYLRILDDRVT